WFATRNGFVAGQAGKAAARALRWRRSSPRKTWSVPDLGSGDQQARVTRVGADADVEARAAGEETREALAHAGDVRLRRGGAGAGVAAHRDFEARLAALRADLDLRGLVERPAHERQQQHRRH